MNVAQAAIETIRTYGVRQVFGIPGDAINHLIDGLHQEEDVDFIHV